ncbi:hypothetical protein COLO4_11212 [Corchorus olitorius]|uniref:BZIP domain-containing protein n=1 Tax=Corchorus olitorius TaxID=93759 RepID=A0A1R3K5D5_9ROSI|nr:hypothetical protein COLO4_11212 [Corchorus olitorius]
MDIQDLRDKSSHNPNLSSAKKMSGMPSNTPTIFGSCSSNNNNNNYNTNNGSNCSSGNSSSSAFTRGGGAHHRRAHSEMSFRLPDDMSIMMMDLSPPTDPINAGGGSSTASLEEIGSEDDLFSTYIDVDKLNSASDAANVRTNCTDHSEGEKLTSSSTTTTTTTTPSSRSRHRHSNSVDGSVYGEVMDAKKAMPPDKLAELWTLDPKHDQCIDDKYTLSNRAPRFLTSQPALFRSRAGLNDILKEFTSMRARSKERKARYIIELERKVQTLQTEATTLSAQLTLFQRDTTGLSTENTELKLRLQAMEQQAHLRDALNEALKKEVERLKIATGEMMSPSESFSLGMHHMPYTASTFLPIPPQHGAAGHQNMALPNFTGSQSSMSTQHIPQTNPHHLSDIMQNDPLGRLQRLDISSKGSNLVKSEGPSISASESSTTF